MSKTAKKAFEKLSTMKVNELQAKFAEVTGETTRSPNKTFLIRRITEALQAAESEAKAAKAKEPETDAHDADRSMQDHEVEILGEALDEFEAFGQRGAAFEPDLEAGLVQSPETVRDPVVLLDERCSDPCLARDDVDEVRELGIFVDERHLGAPAAATHRSTSAWVAFVPYLDAISVRRSASQRLARSAPAKRASSSDSDMPAMS